MKRRALSRIAKVLSLSLSLSLGIAFSGDETVQIKAVAADHSHDSDCRAALSKHEHSGKAGCFNSCGDVVYWYIGSPGNNDEDDEYWGEQEIYYYVYRCTVCGSKVYEPYWYISSGGSSRKKNYNIILEGGVKYTFIEEDVNGYIHYDGPDYNGDGDFSYDDIIACEDDCFRRGKRATPEDLHPGKHYLTDASNRICTKSPYKWYDAYGNEVSTTTYYCDKVVISILPKK